MCRNVYIIYKYVDIYKGTSIVRSVYEIGFLPSCSLPAFLPAFLPFPFHFLFPPRPPRPTRLFPIGRRLPSDALPTDPAGLGRPVFGRVSPCELATLMPCHRGGGADASSLRRSSPSSVLGCVLGGSGATGLLGRADGQGSTGRRRLSFFF